MGAPNQEPDATSPVSADTLVIPARLLGRALELTGVQFDPVSIGKSLRQQQAAQSRRERNGVATMTLLTNVASTVGLHVTEHRATIDGLTRAEVRVPAWVRATGTDVVLIEAIRDGRARVFVGHDEHPRVMSTTQLARLLGVGTAEYLDWASFSAALPMSAVEAHGAEHHDYWKRVRQLISLARDDIGVVIVYAAVVGILSLATPIAVQSLVNTVAFGSLLQPVVILTILFFAAISFAAVLRALETIVVEVVQQKIFARVALDLGHRLPRVRIEAYDGHHGPELANRFFDVGLIQKASTTLLLEGVALVLQAGIGMLVLAFYHPYLLAFDIVLIGVSALVLFGLSRKGVATAVDESYAKFSVAAWMQELARGVSTFRTTGGNALAVEHTTTLIGRYLAARRSHFRVVLRQTIGMLATHVVASSALLVIGGFLVINKQLTLGQLVAAELIVAAVTASLTKFGKLLENTYDLVAAVDKVGRLIDLPLEAGEGAERLAPGAGLNVHISDVVTTRDGYSTEPMSLEMAAGERTAIIFDEGPVRAAFGEMLAGLRAPTAGALTLDGMRPEHADGHVVGDHVAFVRDSDVFHGTIHENVALGRVTVGPAQVRDVLERVGLLEFVQRLPNGIETVLTPSGSPLSSGQVVMLMVARALAGEPRMIVVDAPIDALAPAARTKVIAALSADQAPWTLVCLVGDPTGALARACRKHIPAHAMFTTTETAQ